MDKTREMTITPTTANSDPNACQWPIRKTKWTEELTLSKRCVQALCPIFGLNMIAKW